MNNYYYCFSIHRLLRLVLLSCLLILSTTVTSLARPGGGNDLELYEGIFNFVYENGKVVISDRIFTVDDQTHYADTQGQSITLGNFTPGAQVLFSATEDKKLKELVLQDKAQGTIRQPTEHHQSASEQNIHLEGGVWKN